MKNISLLLILCHSFLAMAYEPIVLSAADFVLATGNPTLQPWRDGSAVIPVWSLSGMQTGQSVSAVTPPLPMSCAGVRIEALIVTNEKCTNDVADVYRAHLAEVAPGEGLTRRRVTGKPVRSTVPARPGVRLVTLESFRLVTGGASLAIRIQRDPEDGQDTWLRPSGLFQVLVTPLAAPPSAHVVENRAGYNSWPMMQSIGKRLVCVYSRGKGHNIGEGVRGAFARTSTDGGRTWTDEKTVANDATDCEVPIGKGLAPDGAALFWVRCLGSGRRHHDLYRTRDGISFDKIASPKFDPWPMQVTDIFQTRHGLMALWFTGYHRDGSNAWGSLVSTDGGTNWVQHAVETSLPTSELPTEQSVAPLGGGRLLGIARNECGEGVAQFQLTSEDDGLTWRKTRTNICDVMASTPTLVFDATTGCVANYYFERGRGVLKRRVARADEVFKNPFSWPAADAVALGSESPWDTGNVNATTIGGRVFLAFYSGVAPDTAIYVTDVP